MPVEPIERDIDTQWVRLDAYQDEPFMPEGRQPPLPQARDIFGK